MRAKETGKVIVNITRGREVSRYDEMMIVCGLEWGKDVTSSSSNCNSEGEAPHEKQTVLLRLGWAR